jgi:hypothetical protein
MTFALLSLHPILEDEQVKAAMSITDLPVPA